MLSTVFSEEPFINAVARSGIHGYRARRFTVDGAPDLFGVAERDRLGHRLHLAPFGLYASPRVEAPQARAACLQILDQIRSVRTIVCRWNVRYDHTDLAAALRERGVPVAEAYTHALTVPATHEAAFARYSTTRRRQVRRAADAGVTVRRARDRESLHAYYKIHRALLEHKQRPLDYPLHLFEALLALDDVVLLVAEIAGAIVGGALYFRDGDSFFYWHGAADRAHSASFPTCAIYDHAIKLACDEKLVTVNFGASAGIDSLEEYKMSWGAERRTYWKFTWTNPLWSIVRRTSRRLARVAQELRHAR